MKSSKLLVEFKAKTIKDKIPLRKQVRENRNSRGAVNVCDDEGLTRVAEFPQMRENRNSRGAVNVCDDEGLTRVAEFPQSCRHRKR
ncbi:hypothetical protein ACROYT_G025766 [Oculina patagonica]